MKNKGEIMEEIKTLEGLIARHKENIERIEDEWGRYIIHNVIRKYENNIATLNWVLEGDK